MQINKSLFPKDEAWATGDEALDLKLNLKLKETVNNLNLDSISSFYEVGNSFKPRAYNPLYKLNIELVTKALLAYFSPRENNDELFKKLTTNYFAKEKVKIDLIKKDIVIEGLKILSKFRYEDEIDFYLLKKESKQRNPFLEFEVLNSPNEIQAKIIFKKFKMILNEEIKGSFENDFFTKLIGGKKIIIISDLGEFWFHQDQIYSLSYFK
jgi:hypothetical protein